MRDGVSHLCHTAIEKVARPAGFEPATPGLEDRHFSADHKAALAELIQRGFGVALPDSKTDREVALKRNNEIFYLCYRGIENASSLPGTFVAQYGLFRCLLTTFGTLLLLGAYQGFVLWWSEQLAWDKTLAVGVLLLICAAISYTRVKKRAADFARAVYDVFFVTTKKALPNRRKNQP